MTEAKPTSRPTGASQLLLDLGPIVTFVLAYNVLLRLPATKDNAVFIATGVFIAVTLAAIAYSKLKFGRVAPVLIVTGVLVTAFGGLAIALRDPNFVEMKPTAMNWFFAVAIAGSVPLKRNLWKLFFGHAFNLPDRIWTVLALRWAGLFLCLGVLNEILRYILSPSDWINWHFPILWVPTLVFAFANTPLVMKHHVEPEAETEAP
jgi:intracellular septation protein